MSNYYTYKAGIGASGQYIASGRPWVKTVASLASGATAGLRPGDELDLYRSQRYFDSLDGTPELSDTGVTLTLDNVHPDFSNGRIPTEGGLINVQRDDLAIIW